MLVEVDGVKSTPRSLSSGVPQGCISSPLFLLCLSMMCVLVFIFHKAQAYFIFYFLFILVRTTTKSIQFINKPVFLFSFFPCCCFAFISKQQQQKNRHFIYDLSMIFQSFISMLQISLFGNMKDLNEMIPALGCYL
jgi:hypothetical protein